jgi:hypothetical protein
MSRFPQTPKAVQAGVASFTSANVAATVNRDITISPIDTSRHLLVIPRSRRLFCNSYTIGTIRRAYFLNSTTIRVVVDEYVSAGGDYAYDIPWEVWGPFGSVQYTTITATYPGDYVRATRTAAISSVSLSLASVQPVVLDNTTQSASYASTGTCQVHEKTWLSSASQISFTHRGISNTNGVALDIDLAVVSGG